MRVAAVTWPCSSPKISLLLTTEALSSVLETLSPDIEILSPEIEETLSSDTEILSPEIEEILSPEIEETLSSDIEIESSGGSLTVDTCKSWFIASWLRAGATE
jgi:hypothetical protein